MPPFPDLKFLTQLTCFVLALTTCLCVLTQGGDEQYRAAWQKICDISRREFDQVYKRLRVTLEEKVQASHYISASNVTQQYQPQESISFSLSGWLNSIGDLNWISEFDELGFACLRFQGESFYNPYIPDVVQQLREKNLIEESEGAQVIKVDGFEIPLIVIKRDGGFNYATTDLTAFW